MPALIYLDLKLPYVHGFEVLSWIRTQENLKHLAVVVLTSSPELRDRERARELGAVAYLVKPPEQAALLETTLFLRDTDQEIPSSRVNSSGS